jgi:hypothetical protein
MIYPVLTFSLIILLLIVLLFFLTLHDAEGVWITTSGDRYLVDAVGWTLNTTYKVQQLGVDKAPLQIPLMSNLVIDPIKNVQIGVYDRTMGSIIWVDQSPVWYRLRETTSDVVSWRLLLNTVRPPSVVGRWMGVRADGTVITFVVQSTTAGIFSVGSGSGDVVALTWNATTKTGSFKTALLEPYTYQWDGSYVITVNDGTTSTVLNQLEITV